MNSGLLTLAVSPVAHVTDKPLVQGQFGGMDLWLVSNVTVMLVVSAVLTCLLVIPAARRIQTGRQRTLDDFRSQGTLANLVESVCVYLRQEVFHGVLGDQTDRFTPMLWTFFWYILICNLVGLIPILDITAMLGWGHHGHGIGGTATQSIWVTGGLAVVSFFFYNATAILKDPVGYLKHLTGGAPVLMWPIMIPVEIMGMLIKPFALAIRLFANMTGGHLVIAVLLSFIGPVIQALGAGGVPVAGLSILGAAGINFLEILVALIQAYIFTFLTCLFLGQLVVHEHDEHHEEHDDHDGHHAVAA